MQSKKILLVHGVFMHPLVMFLLARRLRYFGYNVQCFGYPLRPTADEVGVNFVTAVDAYQPEVIVGHSMGGVMAIKSLPYYKNVPKRIVCLGSPLAGSVIARHVSRSFLSFVFSEASRELLVKGVHGYVGSETFVGLIAGTNRTIGFNTLFRVLSGDHDGTVALRETRSRAVHHRLHLPVGHTAMLFSVDVVDAIFNFIETGLFSG